MTRHADPETVLRLACERQLLSVAGPHHGPGADGLGEVATALVVLAGLPEQAAERTVADYATALALRGQGPMPHQVRPPQPAPPAAPLTPVQVAQVDQQVEVGGAQVHVHCVVHRRQNTEVHVSCQQPAGAPGARPRGRIAARYLDLPPSITITDDRGNAHDAHFSGGGGDGTWTGRWWTERPLPSTSAWLELEGTRIDLRPVEGRDDVTVERHEDGPLVPRYLWHRLSSLDRLEEDPLLLAVLRDAGVLTAADDPLLSAYAEVRAALQDWGRALTTTSPGVPPAFASFLQRRVTATTRDVVVPLSVVTPVVDGFQAAVFHLRTHEEGFAVNAVVRGPGGGVHRHYDFENELHPETLAWWAEDDCGNSYLGSWGEHGSDGTETEGTIYFRPGLDPRATALRLLPTTLHSRAIIEVPLP